MDREKVIKGLECCTFILGKRKCNECPYQRGLPDNGCYQLQDDFHAILQEQEAVEPHSHMTDDSDLYFTCGKCGHVIWSESYKFCPMCATQIAWNGGGM